MVRGFIIFLIILGFLQESCLKKQKRLLQEPSWPKYKIEGWVYNTTTLLPVPNATVIIDPFLFLFHDSIPPETTTSDSQGYFFFPSIPAMAGTLKGYATGYHGFKKEVVIQKPRQFTIFLKPRH